MIPITTDGPADRGVRIGREAFLQLIPGPARAAAGMVSRDAPAHHPGRTVSAAGLARDGLIAMAWGKMVGR
ncbi:hypothetical protein GCM10009753_02580 [Streptantibioticus ferralitis]